MKRIFCRISLTFLAVSLGFFATAQEKYHTAQDSVLVEQYLRELQGNLELPQGEQVMRAARLFVGKPYVASTLEQEPEGLVVNLREMDCTTLVETVIALLQTAQSGSVRFGDYCTALRELRYRDGQIGYVQRLHYIADWKNRNEQRGVLKDMTPSLPSARPLPLKLSFMTSHPDAYRQLKQHPEYVEQLRRHEQEASKLACTYIPKERLQEAASGIKDGDILGFVTSIPGLDVTHLAFACHRDGVLTFLHASSGQKKVVVNPEPLQAYLEKSGKTKGVWVIRILPVSGH